MDKKIENAKGTLKVLGILSIILGAFGIIVGALSIGGGGILAGQMATSGGTSPTDTDAATAVTGLVLVMGIVLLLSGIFSLLLGIFSVRASNDFSKVGPAYVLAIIDLFVTVVGVIFNCVGNMSASSLLGGVVGITFAACIFWAAKTVKDNA